MDRATDTLAVLPPQTDRRRFLGGSDIAAVMGLGAYGRTALSVYFSKIGEAPDELDPDKRKFLERRKRWEGPIVEMLREDFDAEIVAINQRYIDPAHDFLAAEIDFEWRDPADGSIQNGEIKTVSPFAFGEAQGWGEAGTDEVPIHYAAQVMHGLGVTGRRTCIVAAMVGIDNMVFYRVERDEETVQNMRARAVEFWTRNVLAKIPPEPQDMADMMRLYSRVNGKPVIVTGEVRELVEQLRQVRASIKSFELAEEEIAFKICDAVRAQWGVQPDEDPQDNAALICDGVTIATWKKQRGATLDQKRLRAEKPEIVSAYTKEYFFRVLRPAKAK